ncbi:MAG TPA: AAA family ATPase [Candidatus Saccharimonadales bacterium]|nr:AAA family ATPase [Candidatus Saccharimonadales bacterium]
MSDESPPKEKPATSEGDGVIRRNDAATITPGVNLPRSITHIFQDLERKPFGYSVSIKNLENGTPPAPWYLDIDPDAVLPKSKGYSTWFDWPTKRLRIYKDEELFQEIDMHAFENGARLNEFLLGYRQKNAWCDVVTWKSIMEEIENALINLGISCDPLSMPSAPSVPAGFLFTPSDVPLPWMVRDARSIGELELPGADDPNELLKERFLCRGGGLLLVGPTGVGKSSLSMQMAVCFSLGNHFFGIMPAAPLRSLIVQAENDDGDMAEMFQGVCRGMALSDEDKMEAGWSIKTIAVDSKRGDPFFDNALEPLLACHQPDILWIDPALAYIDGDSNTQKDAGKWLRAGLNPLLHKHNCAAVVVHHTAKPPRGPGNVPLTGSDRAYMGSGSAEFANWARAVISIQSTGAPGVFELSAGKRSSRIGWKSADGATRVDTKLIAHSKEPGVICWNEYDGKDLSAESAIKGMKTMDDVMAHVPTNETIEKKALMSKCCAAKISRRGAEDLIAEAIDAKRLFEWQVKRPGARPQIHVARNPQPVELEVAK